MDDPAAPDAEEKPLGVRYMELYGCPLEDAQADCGDTPSLLGGTKVSTNNTSYRHVG